MFTSSTFLSLYAQARRDEDLRPPHGAPRRHLLGALHSLLPSKQRRATPTRPVPVIASR